MEHVGSVLYLILFYICVVCFFYSFDTFTFQEKIIMFTLFSGFNCMAALIRGRS